MVIIRLATSLKNSDLTHPLHQEPLDREYDAALWNVYRSSTLDKLNSAYNNNVYQVMFPV